MGFSPSEWPLPPKYLFGALLPGAVATAGAFYFLRATSFGMDFRNLTVPAQWAVFGGIGLTIGFLAFVVGAPLDWLYNMTYRRYKRRKGDAAFEFARGLAESEQPGISKYGDVYEWAKNRVAPRDPAVRDEVSLEQGISKMFRGFALILSVAAILLYRQGATLPALGSVATALVCFLIFCQRRWTASVFIYQRLRELERAAQPSSIIRL